LWSDRQESGNVCHDVMRSGHQEEALSGQVKLQEFSGAILE